MSLTNLVEKCDRISRIALKHNLSTILEDYFLCSSHLLNVERRSSKVTDPLANLLNQIIPDEKILADLWKIIEDGSNKVELNDNWIEIQNKIQIDIVTKAYFLESFPNIGFGVYKVLLALGGFNQDMHGFHSAGICFSTMFYGQEVKLISLDFHEEFR